MQVPNKTVGNRGTLRKVLSMLLAVAMIVFMLPVTAYASVSDEQEHWGQTVNSIIQTDGRPILNAVKELLSETKEDAEDDSEANSGTVIDNEPEALDDAVLDNTIVENRSSELLSIFEEGDGTAKSPYQIATAEQLDQVRNYLDESRLGACCAFRMLGIDRQTWLPGGVDVKEMSCDSLLKNISMVFQKVYLFHDTILNNLRFGKPNASFEEVVETAKKVVVTISL